MPEVENQVLVRRLMDRIETELDQAIQHHTLMQQSDIKEQTRQAVHDAVNAYLKKLPKQGGDDSISCVARMVDQVTGRYWDKLDHRWYAKARMDDGDTIHLKATKGLRKYKRWRKGVKEQVFIDITYRPITPIERVDVSFPSS